MKIGKQGGGFLPAIYCDARTGAWHCACGRDCKSSCLCACHDKQLRPPEDVQDRLCAARGGMKL